MDSQHYEYWRPQQEPYTQPPATYYEYATPDLASIPSLSASPTSTATFDAAGTPTPAPSQQSQPMQQQQQHLYHHQPASSYHHAAGGSSSTPFAYAVSTDFGSVDAAAVVAASSALPSPPYVCSPQQSNADLGAAAAYHHAAAAAVPQQPPPSASAHHEASYPPLQIVNEAGFDVGGQGGRAPPMRSASNGSTWSAGSVSGVQAERTHVTSGRRRAQNRAAQRAFRERKEKHAKDLEAKLAILSERYGRLEASHKELGEAYEKLRRTLELLTSPTADEDDDDEDDAEGEVVMEDVGADVDALLARGLGRRRDWGERETLRKVMAILHAPRTGMGEGERGGEGRMGVKCES